MGEHAEKFSVLLEHPFILLCSGQMALGKNISNKFDVFTLICTIFAKDKYRDLSAGIRRI